MKKLIRIVSLLLIIFLITGCEGSIFSGLPENETIESAEYDFIGRTTGSDTLHTQFRNVNPDGSFAWTQNGVISVVEDITSPYTINIFFDPLCGGCLFFNLETYEQIDEWVKDNKVTLFYHPLMFLHLNTPTGYSQRASAIIIGLAEFAPHMAGYFVEAILMPNFIFDRVTADISNSELFDLAKELGATQEQINLIIENIDYFADMTFLATDIFVNNSNSFGHLLSPDGAPFTPFVLVNNTGEISSMALSLQGECFLEELIKKFETLNED